MTSTIRAVAAAPQTPQLGGPTLPKGAPNCLEGPEVASIQKQSFAWRIALNGIFFRSDSIYFSFKIFRYRLLSNSVINCIMMS